MMMHNMMLFSWHLHHQYGGERPLRIAHSGSSAMTSLLAKGITCSQKPNVVALSLINPQQPDLQLAISSVDAVTLKCSI